MEEEFKESIMIMIYKLIKKFLVNKFYSGPSSFQIFCPNYLYFFQPCEKYFLYLK